ncbi:MAG: hypothetical protein AAF770_01095 [Bacteroidota bacterium]
MHTATKAADHYSKMIDSYLFRIREQTQLLNGMIQKIIENSSQSSWPNMTSGYKKEAVASLDRFVTRMTESSS